MREECRHLKGRKKDLCEGRGFDGRQNPLQSASDDFRASIGLDSITVTEPQSRQIVPSRPPVNPVSQIGTRLRKIFESKYGAIPCSSCKAMIESLNQSTVEFVLKNKQSISMEIYENSKNSKMAWWAKFARDVDDAATGGFVARSYLLRYIEEACNGEEQRG